MKTSHPEPHEAVYYWEKKETRPNTCPEIPEDLKLWRRPACQMLSKALDISSATARVAPDLLKALAILSDTTVRRSPVSRVLAWLQAQNDYRLRIIVGCKIRLTIRTRLTVEIWY